MDEATGTAEAELAAADSAAAEVVAAGGAPAVGVALVAVVALVALVALVAVGSVTIPAAAVNPQTDAQIRALIDAVTTAPNRL